MKKLLILDLDDTIFETKSITKESVSSILQEFENNVIEKYGKSLTNQIISEFWKLPFDILAKKYQLDKQVKQELAKSISQTSFDFNINPYKDFEVLKSLNLEKILVTTGFDKLQQAKIKNLKIEAVFSEIYIDDILDSNRIFKKGIFTNILKKRNIKKEHVFIIGDNTQSELKAGFQLGLHTVQVSRYEQEKSRYANHLIQDFCELIAIIR